MDGFNANYYHNDSVNSWEIQLDGKYTRAINDYLLSDGIPLDGVSKITENAAKVLNYCPNPETDDRCQKTGIVIGKVQSGKTSNFITLTALAFDNGYNLVVILGGTKKDLVTQNRDRINEYFEDCKDVVVLDTVNHRGEMVTNKIQQFIRMGRKVILVVLKNTTQINFVKNNVFVDSSFVDKPILLIDDEGDEASLNNLVKKGKKSKTYEAIEGLKTILNRHCFVSVTATPQANLLIDTLDILSPDFGILVDPGKGYCGLDVFHSDTTYTVEIPDKESSLLDDGIPKSFVKALSMFFVACAIRRFRGMKPGDKVSMLIHPSHIKEDHKIAAKKVEKVIKDWIAMTSDKDDIAYNDVRDELVSAYNEYAKTTVKQIPSFSTIEDDVITAINACGIHTINTDNPSRSDDFYDYNIYVGGQILGRGITLKGLTITYIIRTSKGVSAVDTVQQRARWFGYKSKYLDLCRVFAVPKILNEFQHIGDHEEDLWDTIRDYNQQGEDFKNMARIFVLDDNLRMTQTNRATTVSYTFYSWNKQRVFQFDPELIQSNEYVINRFKSYYSQLIYTKTFGSGAPYTIIPSDFNTVFSDVLSKFIFPSGDKLNYPILSKLKTLLSKKNLNPAIDVIWMRDDITKPSQHEIRDDKTIPNYSVGRRPQDESLPIRYAGDDYQFRKDDTMQLQIHMIQDKRTMITSPTLALYIPKNVVEKLTNLVIKA